jgi:hypothetical protein
MASDYNFWLKKDTDQEIVLDIPSSGSVALTKASGFSTTFPFNDLAQPGFLSYFGVAGYTSTGSLDPVNTPLLSNVPRNYYGNTAFFYGGFANATAVLPTVGATIPNRVQNYHFGDADCCFNYTAPIADSLDYPTTFFINRIKLIITKANGEKITLSSNEFGDTYASKCSVSTVYTQMRCAQTFSTYITTLPANTSQSTLNTYVAPGTTIPLTSSAGGNYYFYDLKIERSHTASYGELTTRTISASPFCFGGGTKTLYTHKLNFYGSVIGTAITSLPIVNADAFADIFNINDAMTTPETPFSFIDWSNLNVKLPSSALDVPGPITMELAIETADVCYNSTGLNQTPPATLSPSLGKILCTSTSLGGTVYTPAQLAANPGLIASSANAYPSSADLNTVLGTRQAELAFQALMPYRTRDESKCLYRTSKIPGLKWTAYVSRDGSGPGGLMGKAVTNNTKVDSATNTYIVYDDDGATPLLEYDLSDNMGQPSVNNVFERKLR